MKHVAIGPIVAGLRKTRKIRQMDLAREVDIKQTMLSRIESGQVAPRQQTLQRIAEVLEVSIADLYDPGIFDRIAYEFRPPSSKHE